MFILLIAAVGLAQDVGSEAGSEVVPEAEYVPRAQTDYTAYTLEGGEFRIGLVGLGVGIVPRVQVATIPVLDAFGVWNGSAKWNFLRLGPVDLAADASHLMLQVEGFRGRYSTLGGMGSIAVTDGWGIHGGAQYNRVGARGAGEIMDLTPLFDDELADQLREWGVEDEVNPRFEADLVTVRVATDFRVTKTGSIVLQGQAAPYGRARLEAEGPPIFGLDQVVERGGQIPLDATYVATVSWQQSWENLDMRVGGGASAIPYLWLLQATDVAARFGGVDRRQRRIEAEQAVVDAAVEAERARVEAEEEPGLVEVEDGVVVEHGVENGGDE